MTEMEDLINMSIQAKKNRKPNIDDAERERQKIYLETLRRSFGSVHSLQLFDQAILPENIIWDKPTSKNDYENKPPTKNTIWDRPM